MSCSKNICSISTFPCRINGQGGDLEDFEQGLWESSLKESTQLAGTCSSSSSNLDMMFSAPAASGENGSHMLSKAEKKARRRLGIDATVTPSE